MMTAAVSFVAVARGEVLCLCDEDPDDCGQVCHTCGEAVPDGLSGEECCLHLEIAPADLVLTNEEIRLSFEESMPELPFFIADASALGLWGQEPFEAFEKRSASPPTRVASFCCYSHRLFPRS